MLAHIQIIFPVLMLRKLGRYPRQNGLALALRELGRRAITESGV
jgi:TnpA family transposase